MQSEWRVACVRIPRFPIGAVWRQIERRELARAIQAEPQLTLSLSEPVPGRDDAGKRVSGLKGSSALTTAPGHWDTRPIVLVDDQRIRTASAAAGQLRVRAGMTVTEARARCASLEVLDWDPVALEAELTRLTAALLVASPQVTPVAGAPGLWWVGASGFDSLGGERGLVRALLRVARLWHPQPRVAVADSCVAARAATWEQGTGNREQGTGNIIPPGGCAAYLADVPLGLIPLDEEFRAALRSLGVRTAGGLATLDAGELERRWGAVGLSGWRLTHGDDPRRPVLARAEATRTVHAELATPVTTMEPILFLVRSALDRLVRQLVADGRAAATIALTLTLDDGRGAMPIAGPAHTVTREVRVPRPLARVAPLFERCRAVLDRWTLDAPACAVTVCVVATAPASGEQGDLMRTSWRDPAAVDAALERLRAELGPNVVVRPVAGDEHRVEREGSWTGEDHSCHPGQREEPALSPGQASALRLLDPPEAIEIERSGAGVPAAMWWRGGHVTLTRADGPERLSGDWWKDGYQREYWRCEGERDAEFLLFRDHAAWYLHGWYD